MRRNLLFLLVIVFCSLRAYADDKLTSFSDGFFIVNEDWYGHNNSTINWFGNDGTITTRVVQTVNGSDHQLGCTAPVGKIWNGLMYITSKQAQDPGANVTGGRLTVCDAKTMKFVKKWEEFPNGGDGRDVCGVSADKVYVGSTNGIYVLDSKTMEFTGQVRGVGSDGLYSGQVGTIIATGGMVYAVSQKDGLYVIDPAKDAVTDTIPVPADAYEAGDKYGSLSFGAAVLKSGCLWLSVAAVSGSGSAKNVIVKYDLAKGTATTIPMTAGCYGPANSWYAWTPDGLCASEKEDCLFWNGGSGSWFAKQTIYRFDIKTNETNLIIDLQDTNDNLYGACLRCNPETGDIVMGLSMEQPYGNDYQIRVYTSTGELRYTYYLKDGNYWFPSVPVFPQVERKLVADTISEALVPLSGYKDVDITHAAHDNFLIHALMKKEVLGVEDDSVASAELYDANFLRVTGKKSGRTNVKINVITDVDTVLAIVPVNVAFQYLLQAKSAPHSDFTFSGTGYYLPGETATLEAKPAYGYEFTRWSDGVLDAKREVLMNGDSSFTAEAKRRNFAITVKAGVGGSVLPEGKYDVAYLDTMKLTAVPDEHYNFTRWSDGVKTAVRDFVVTKDQTITANFEGKPDSVKLSVFPVNAGTVSGAKTVKYGSKIYVSARAATGYVFSHWSDGDTNTGRYVTGNGETIELTAVFEELQFDLALAASPADGGTVTGAGTYAYGSDVTITAESAEGYVFTGWSDGETSAERVVTMTDSLSLVANFEAKPTGVDTPAYVGTETDAAYDLAGRTIRSDAQVRIYIKGGKIRIKK